MSELKPWDEGYVAPQPDPLVQHKAMAKAREANQVRIKEKKAKDPNFKQHVRDPESKTTQKLLDRDENIRPKTKKMYNRFVREYLYDFSAVNAYVRAGGSPHTPAHAYQILKTGYVQRRLKKLIEAIEEDELVADKQIIIGIAKEANSFGDGTSQTGRVAAWKLLAQLKGKLIKKTESTVNNTGGVMLIPVPASTEQWETMAQTSQEQLKNDVRT